jgi:hypothetical protein
LLSWFSVTTSLGSVCLTTVLVDTPCGLPLPSQRALNVIVLKPPSLSPHRPVAKRGSPPKVCDYNPLPGRQITCPSIPLPHHYHQYHVLVGLRRRGLHALAMPYHHTRVRTRVYAIPRYQWYQLVRIAVWNQGRGDVH